MSSLTSVTHHLSGSFPGEKSSLLLSTSHESQRDSRLTRITIHPSVIPLTLGQDSLPSAKHSLPPLDPIRVQSLSESSQSQTPITPTSDSDSTTDSPMTSASQLSLSSTPRSSSLDSLRSPSSLSSSPSPDTSILSRSSSSSLSSTDSPMSSRSSSTGSRNSSTGSTPTFKKVKSATLSKSLSRSLSAASDTPIKISYAVSNAPSPSGRFIDGPTPLAPMLNANESIVLRSGSVNLHIVPDPSAVAYRNGQQTLASISEGKDVRSTELSTVSRSSTTIASSLKKLYEAEPKSVKMSVEIEKHTSDTPLNTWKRLLLTCTPLSKDALDEIELHTPFFKVLLEQPHMPMELFRKDRLKRLLAQTGFFTIISNIVSEKTPFDIEIQQLPNILRSLKKSISQSVQTAISEEALDSLISEQLTIAIEKTYAFTECENQSAKNRQRQLAAAIRETLGEALQLQAGTSRNPEEMYSTEVLAEEQALTEQARIAQELITTTIQDELAKIKKQRSNAIFQKLMDSTNIQQQKDIVRALVEAATIANREAETTTTTIVVPIPARVDIRAILRHQLSKDKQKLEVAGLKRYEAWTSYGRIKEEMDKLEKCLSEHNELIYTRRETIDQIMNQPGKGLLRSNIKKKLDQDKPLPSNSFFGKLKNAIKPPKAKEFALVDVERLTIWLRQGYVLPSDIFNYYKRIIEHKAREEAISQESVDIVVETILPTIVNTRTTTEQFAKHPIIRDAKILNDFIERIKSHFETANTEEENPIAKTKFSYKEMLDFAEMYIIEKLEEEEKEYAAEAKAIMETKAVSSREIVTMNAEKAQKKLKEKEERTKVLFSMLLGILMDWGSEALSPEDAREFLLDHLKEETALAIDNMNDDQQLIVQDLFERASTMCARILNEDQRREIQKMGHLDREPTEKEKMVGDNAFKIPPEPQERT